MDFPPVFLFDNDYSKRLNDVTFWGPFVRKILNRHGLRRPGIRLESGKGGTYPTFLSDEFVVKLYGHAGDWRKSFAEECHANRLLATNSKISVPRTLFEGELFTGDRPWPYLVSERAPGHTWQIVELSASKDLEIAADLGRLIKQTHALEPNNIKTDADWPRLDATAAAAKSSLPPYMLPQINEFLTRVTPFDRAFVNGDIVRRHIFVSNRQFSGLIDWGDAVVTDRHYELAKLHLDAFRCDTRLLAAFLETSQWPMANNFATQALGMALIRQAVGLTQNLGTDVFQYLPNILTLHDFATLDELAIGLFGV